MGERTVLGRLADGQGNITVVFDDGSTATMNAYGQVTAQDPSPNPSRAAMMRSGDEAGAKRTVEAASQENARRFDATLQVQQDTLKNNYAVSMANAKTTQEQQKLTAEYQRAQIDLAKQKFQFDQQVSSRDFGQRQYEFGANLGQRQHEFDTNTDIQRAQIGNTLVGTLAGMRGAENYFQASNYARGIAAEPGTAGFLSALQSNTRLPGYGAQAGAPDAMSYGGLVGKLTGGMGQGGVGSASTNDGYVSQIHNIAASGAQALAPGSWERLSPDEQKLFLSGLEAPDEQGHAYNSSDFLSQYYRSRPGQGIAGSRAA